MNHEREWLVEQCGQLKNTAAKYEERAFFEQLSLFVITQDQRINQARSELDGRIWNPSKW